MGCDEQRCTFNARSAAYLPTFCRLHRLVSLTHSMLLFDFQILHCKTILQKWCFLKLPGETYHLGLWRWQVSESLRTLNGVTRHLRRGRQEAGALSLASPEVKFEIDTETHDPLDVGVYQVLSQGSRHVNLGTGREGGGRGQDHAFTPSALSVNHCLLSASVGLTLVRYLASCAGCVARSRQKRMVKLITFNESVVIHLRQVREANQMVEEMMLLANTSVAAAILKAYPACALLRRHPTPQPRNFEPLLAAAAAAGFSLDVSSSKVLARHLFSISSDLFFVHISISNMFIIPGSK